MKFIHTSDLHLGKRVNEFSLLEDQKYMLGQLLSLAEAEKPELFLIAGDVYDKTVPPVEAVSMFDWFINSLSKLGIIIAVISGNHDSAERLGFGSSLMEKEGLYISPPYSGSLRKVELKDDFGPYSLWLMPFLRPGLVRPFTQEPINSYNDGLREALRLENPDFSRRNILLAHQFVTGSVLSESEEFAVGGLDCVEAQLFSGFDYVALGHIHRSQQAGAPQLRYSGSPMKFSFSEALQEKTVTLGSLGEKGDLELSAVKLERLRDMREIKGPFSALMDGEYTQDYIHCILTDEEEIPEAVGRLRLKYPQLMRLSYDNRRTKAQGITEYRVEKKKPLDMFKDFYLAQNGIELSPQQEEYMQGLTGEVEDL